MKRKPLWGLWLLIIVVPFAVFFGVREKRKLRDRVTRDEVTFDDADRSAAAQGLPHLSQPRLTALPDNSGAWVRLSFFNLSGVTEIDAKVVSGAAELVRGDDGSSPKNGDNLNVNCYGTPYCDTTMCSIKTSRRQPIRLHIEWIAFDATKHYRQSRKDIVITPQMKAN